MKFKQILKSLGKNLLIFLIGGIVGTAIAVVWILGFWAPANSEEIGLAMIAILPVMLVLFSGIGLVVGGILGLIIFYLKKFIFKNKS